jgi:type VI secretion system secreted protein VgrG
MAVEARKDIKVTLAIQGLASGSLRPTALRVREAISGARALEVEAAGEPGDVRAMLRKGAQIDVLAGGEPVRRFEGIVLRVKERWRGDGAIVSLTIGSPLDVLALSTDCRIFQNMTMPEIVKSVLTACGIPEARVKSRLSATYPKLASCTQFRETMLAFVSRLLEADGAFWFFEDGPDGLDLVLGDSPDAHRAASPAELPFVTDAGLHFTNGVTEVTELSALRPSKVTLRDLDWTKPDLDLTATEEKAAPGSRELYDHPGGHADASHGKLRAKARLEALVASTSGVRGRAVAPGLAAGKTFTLSHAPRADLDVEYVVVEAEHSWSASTSSSQALSTTFRALPKSVPFRPLARTPKPRISGPHTAIVTGPSGQEIHTDEHGRVTLKFPWDRHAAFDEKSSAWARVAQLAMGGSMAIPRIGWEVLVEFEHGDPDRPVVVGRLYNATYLPPYALPEKKTVSTLMSYSSPKGEGHNEIRIDDAAGAEHIHVHAQKDLTLAVANDRATSVATSRMVTIKADEAVTVKGNRATEIKGMWQVTVAGSQTHAVDGARDKTVKKDEKHSVTGDRSVSITGSHTLKTSGSGTISAEGDVSQTIAGSLDESADEGVSVAVGDDLSLTIGGAKSEIAKKGKTETTDGKRSASVGGAASHVAGKDLAVLVGGKHTSTVGAAWSMTAGGDMELSSGDALELTIGAALAMTGASGIAFKVGSSKVFVGQGGVVIDASKVKITSDGPAAILGALVGSK